MSTLFVLDGKSIELDYVCPECNGAGTFREYKEDEIDCGECDGRGYKLTESGEAFIRFHQCWIK